MRVMNTRKAAEYLQTSPAMIRYYVAKGLIQAEKNGNIQIPVKELNRFRPIMEALRRKAQ